MKKFLETMNSSAAGSAGYVQALKTDAFDAAIKLAELQKQYKKLEGHRALYRNKPTKEMRVVTILTAGKRFITVEYNCYSATSENVVRVSISYFSLLCGDSSLEVE